jgi:HSP20 family protein
MTMWPTLWINRLGNPVDDLRRQVDRLLTNFDTRDLFCAPTYPPVNIWDAGEALVVEAELAGVRDQDLEVSAMGNELTIAGRRTPADGDKQTYHRRERGTGEFTRVITLPAEVDADQVEATLKDGVLTVRLPKAESAKPRKIALKTN